MTMPAEYQDELNSLAAADKLYGVPALVFVAVAMAESNGTGGAVNSEGYGGFFGLGVNTQYPTGSVDYETMVSTSLAALDVQAEVAAGEFASLLNRTGGNIYQAERDYQGGVEEGVDVMISLGVPESIPWPPVPPPPPPEVTVKSILVQVTAQQNGQGATLVPYSIGSIAATSLEVGEEVSPRVRVAESWAMPHGKSQIIVKGCAPGEEVTVNVALYSTPPA